MATLPECSALAALEAAVSFGGFLLGELWELPKTVAQSGGVVVAADDCSPVLCALFASPGLATGEGGSPPLNTSVARALGAEHRQALRIVAEAASQRHIVWAHESEGDEVGVGYTSVALSGQRNAVGGSHYPYIGGWGARPFLRWGAGEESSLPRLCVWWPLLRAHDPSCDRGTIVAGCDSLFLFNTWR